MLRLLTRAQFQRINLIKVFIQKVDEEEEVEQEAEEEAMW